jgi:hypothetical protein
MTAQEHLDAAIAHGERPEQVRKVYSDGEGIDLLTEQFNRQPLDHSEQSYSAVEFPVLNASEMPGSLPDITVFPQYRTDGRDPLVYLPSEWEVLLKYYGQEGHRSFEDFHIEGFERDDDRCGVIRVDHENQVEPTIRELYTHIGAAVAQYHAHVEEINQHNKALGGSSFFTVVDGKIFIDRDASTPDRSDSVFAIETGKGEREYFSVNYAPDHDSERASYNVREVLPLPPRIEVSSRERLEEERRNCAKEHGEPLTPSRDAWGRCWREELRWKNGQAYSTAILNERVRSEGFGVILDVKKPMEPKFIVELSKMPEGGIAEWQGFTVRYESGQVIQGENNLFTGKLADIFSEELGECHDQSILKSNWDITDYVDDVSPYYLGMNILELTNTATREVIYMRTCLPHLSPCDRSSETGEVMYERTYLRKGFDASKGFLDRAGLEVELISEHLFNKNKVRKAGCTVSYDETNR